MTQTPSTPTLKLVSRTYPNDPPRYEVTLSGQVIGSVHRYEERGYPVYAQGHRYVVGYAGAGWRWMACLPGSELYSRDHSGRVTDCRTRRDAVELLVRRATTGSWYPTFPIPSRFKDEAPQAPQAPEVPQA